MLQAIELQRWKSEEERRIEEARLAEEAALAMVEQEKAKSRAAIEAAEAAKRIAELEAQKRINAEKKAFKEAEEKKKALDALANNDVRYRKYSIDEIETATEFFSESLKIGEEVMALFIKVIWTTHQLQLRSYVRMRLKEGHSSSKR